MKKSKKILELEKMYDDLSLDHNNNFSRLLVCEEKIESYEKQISDLKKRNRELFNGSLENVTSEFEISFLNDSIAKYRMRIVFYSMFFFTVGYIFGIIISNLYE